MLNFLFTQTPLAFLTQSFWRDEAFSYFLAKKNILEIISLSVKDFNPPLYYLFLHFWLRIFGPSEVSLRSFSLVFFWATLYVCFLFLRETLKLNLKKSLLYLLLFLINPVLSFYAFEARNYTLFAFFATLSYYSFYKKSYRLYFITTVLGLYTHYFMLFVVFSQLFFNYFISRKGRRYKFIKRISLKPLFVFLPWFLFVLIQKNFFASSFWIERINIKRFLNFLGIIYTGYERGITLISLAIILLIIVGLKVKAKKIQERELILYLALWGIGIPFITALISFFKSIFISRYLIFSTVGLLLLLVLILERLKVGIRMITIILLVIIALSFQKNQIQQRKKTDFQKIAREIKALAKKDDLIYVTSELDFFTAKYYLAEKKVLIFNKSYEEIPDFVGKVLISKNDIAASLPSYPMRAFVLRSDGNYLIQALY